MNTLFRCAAVAALVLALAGPATAAPVPEPLPLGVPYVYQPGNNYWYAPVVPVHGTYWVAPVAVAYGHHRVAPVAVSGPYLVAPVVARPHVVYYGAVVYPYPFASSGPVYGRYAWDYTGYYSAGYGSYSTNLPHYPYSYQYPTLAGRVWMGYGW